MKIKEITLPVVFRDGKPWFLLGTSDSGLLRAVRVSKPRQVNDWDGHHCSQVSVKGSIRYHPKKWDWWRFT